MSPRQVIDDGYLPAQQLSVGQADSSVDAPPTAFDGVRAILWLPDPEQRHGWREFYVRAEAPKPGGKFGFSSHPLTGAHK